MESFQGYSVGFPTVFSRFLLGFLEGVPGRTQMGRYGA